MERNLQINLPTGTAFLHDDKAARICHVLEHAGYKIYFVGGCVRNALMGVPISDIDMSTNARPETVMQLARDAGLKAIPTGVEHGTVTVVVEETPFEITTFRRDVATDGRRAVVAFSDDITEDALRRDFTMNALYATPQGQLADPLNGYQDARKRRVRFIEDAPQRIREDYLRILRYFRFHAFYADADQGFDAETLDAIAQNLEGLTQLSPERIGAEMLKILSAADPAPTLACMRQCFVLSRLFPEMDDKFLGPLIHVESLLGLQPDPIRRLAVLGGKDLDRALRLSRAQSKRLGVLHQHIGSMCPLPELGYRLDARTALDILALRSAVFSQAPDNKDIADIHQAAAAVFPITARDLMPRFSGPALGQCLKTLESQWIASGFHATKSELLKSMG